MYIPQQYQIPEAQALELAEKIGRGQFIGQVAGRWESTLLPFLVERRGEKIIVQSHISKVNPQWKCSGSGLIVVNGVQGQVHGADLPPNPAGARLPRVPTLDYIQVHLRGKFFAYTDREWKIAHLQKMLQRFEGDWDLSAADQKLLDNALPALVGVEMEVAEIAGKAKLHQNLLPEEISFTAENMAARGGEYAEVAQAMEKIAVPWAQEREARVASVEASRRIPLRVKTEKNS